MAACNWCQTELDKTAIHVSVEDNKHGTRSTKSFDTWRCVGLWALSREAEFAGRPWTVESVEGVAAVVDGKLRLPLAEETG